MFWFFQNLTVWLFSLIFILLSVAIFTLLERLVLAAVQRRQGPTIIGFFGILQPIADGVKLVLKETIFPQSADIWIFIFAPIITFALALCLWPVIPFDFGYVIADSDYGILYIFMISSLGVHSVIMAGWSSNSKYAFLGALRSAAQMISYEIPLGIILAAIVLLTRSFNLSDIVLQQTIVWNIIPLFPVFLIFFICILAETNRHPFDLPEAESELVSGYNVEYAAIGFALFFLAEYSNIIVMSILTSLFFFGGWLSFGIVDGISIQDYMWDFEDKPWFQFLVTYTPLEYNALWEWISFDHFSVIYLTFKTLFFMWVFILVRATFPRYRYDQLMRLGWKIFLPLTLAFVILLMCVLITTNTLINFSGV